MRFPIITSIFVAAAIGTMIALGIWQLDRAKEKDALIAAFERQSAKSEIVPIEHGTDDLIYRTVRFDCADPRDWAAVSGRNADGQAGYAHRFVCDVAQPVAFDAPTPPPVTTFADIGWSRSPDQPEFTGGELVGTLVSLGRDYKVVAQTPPVDGLEPLARPNPADMPNNHIAYAGQWFFFALTALVIFVLAVRRKRGDRSETPEPDAAEL